MSGLRQQVDGYLAVRRSLGFRMARPEKLLAQFAGYLEQAGAGTVTTEHALAWAVLPGGHPSWHAYRLAVARGFAAWLRTVDPAAEIPPAGLIPARKPRATPYLYADDEVVALMAAAESLRTPLRTATYQTLIGLLAATGMRVGEAIGLDRGDLDPEQGLLTIRDGKFGKSRQLPLHDSALRALAGYARLRDSRRGRPPTPAFFTSVTGTRLIYQNVHFTFHGLTRAAGLHPRSAACRPRIHDLRHAFAVATLARWYADGGDVAARLPLLSTWLGHADPAGTYWYLTGTPELLALAAARLEPGAAR